MATIDKLDISVYNMYAIRTLMIEQTNQQLRLSDAAAIPPQIQMVDIFPKMNELDLLMGVVSLNSAYAYFGEPPKLRFLRRSPFAFHRVAPSLGSLQDHAKDVQMLESIVCTEDDEIQEKKAMLNCFAQIDRINHWLGYIVGRVGQFLQG